MDIPLEWRKYDDLFESVLGAPSTYICSSDSRDLPQNLWPYLGNGYIGTQPNSRWIFVDGLFNGTQTESHRACVPSPIQWRLHSLFSVDEGGQHECTFSQDFWMHFGMGVFMHRLRSETCEICTSTFVSRASPTLLVRFVTAHFPSPSESSSVLVRTHDIVSLDTPDCEVTVLDSVEGRLSLHGRTRFVESPDYQCQCSSFYLHTDVLPDAVLTGFRLSPTASCLCFLTSISRVSMDDAIAGYECALSLYRQNPDQLLTEHANAWLRMWQCGCIRLALKPATENMEDKDSPVSFSLLPLIIQASQYSLLTCVPDFAEMHPPLPMTTCSFFGLCPTGLARGNEEDDYMGHVFWDMEIWMLPWFNLFHPQLCRLALDYRYALLSVAKDRAIRDGVQGARFPWESAFTGVETTPWKLAADNQIHVVGAVSFAVQQWLIAHANAPHVVGTSSSDADGEPRQWYNEKGRVLLEEVARFWYSRLKPSCEKGCFEIIDVMPPDEYTHCCRNSAYTSAIAASALAAPAVVARHLCASANTDYDMWEEASGRIWMPRDFTHRLMLEHEDYVLGTCVKQADTVLLMYPLMYEQPEIWEHNMLDCYARVTDLNGPAMTWSIFCVCALQLKDYDHAMEYFKRSLLHVRGPYCSWTETTTSGGGGAANFLTGAAGFLQSIVNGFVGVRIRLIPHQLVVGTHCPAHSHAIPALFLTRPSEIATACWDSIHLNGVHFQSCTLRVVMDLTRRRWRLSLTSSGTALAIFGREHESWVFDELLSPGDSAVDVTENSLCLVESRYAATCLSL